MGESRLSNLSLCACMLSRVMCSCLPSVMRAGGRVSACTWRKQSRQDYDY